MAAALCGPPTAWVLNRASSKSATSERSGGPDVEGGKGALEVLAGGLVRAAGAHARPAPGR